VIDNCSDDQLRALVSLRQGSLTTLEIKDVWVSPASALLLRHALERFGDSLQHLAVALHIHNTPLDIHFPSRMRELRTLTVFLMSNSMGRLPSPVRVHIGEPPRSEPVNQNEEGEGANAVDYGRHFPSLAKLTVWPVDHNVCSNFGKLSVTKIRKSGEIMGWDAFHPFLSAFLPCLRPSFPNPAKALDIPFVLRGKYHPVLDNLEVIFPAVAFSQEVLAEARRCLHWTEDDEASSY